jgi:HAE1 family hydrophobic/amphiphilic exporter-1
VLAGLAEEAARRLRAVEGVTSVRTEAGDEGDREMHFVVDPDKAMRFGLSAWSVGGAIDFALRGRELDAFRSGEEELPILVQGNLSEVDEAGELEELQLRSPVDDDIVLRDVATAHTTMGYGSIDRENRRTILSITVLSMREDVDGLRADIDSVLEGMAWPRGYHRELAGRFDGMAEEQTQQNTAVVLAIVCVFLLMGVLFESIVLPFSILLSIPFAFVGVYWALFLTGTPFDMMAGVGVIILIGIVVNNAIVLVDRIGELRREGMEREEAIALAGQQRLRPIVMTALTTIFGLIPMAMGTNSLIGIPYSPLGRSVIGGLIASTALTLFVVPLIYTFLDDAREWVLRGAVVVLPRSRRSGSKT